MDTIQFWSLIAMLAAGFAWLIHRMDKLKDQIDTIKDQLNGIDKRLTCLEMRVSFIEKILEMVRIPFRMETKEEIK